MRKERAGDLDLQGAMQRRIEQLESQVADLRGVQRRYESLIRNPLHLVFISPLGDLNQIKFSEASDGACRLLGYSREELLTMGPTDIIDQEDRGRFDADLEVLGTRGEISAISRLRARDGSHVSIEFHVKVFEDCGQLMLMGCGRDLEPRHRAWKYLHALIDASPDMSLLMRPDGEILTVNTFMARRLGMSMASELVGLNIGDLLPAGLLEARKVWITRVIETGRPVQFEDEQGGRILRHDVLPAYDDDDQLMALAIHSRDITDEALLQKEKDALWRRLRLLTDNLPAHVAYVDREVRYRFVNAKYEEKFGRRKDEIEGERLEDIMGAEGFASRKDYIERALTGESLAFTSEFPYPVGPSRWLDIRYVPDRQHGEVVGFYVLAMDVDERVRAEQASQRLLKAIEQADESVIITDAENRIEYVNKAFTELTGYTAEEVLGRDLCFLHSDEHDDAFCEEAWKVLNRGDSWSGRIVSHRKDGRTFTEAVTISPVRDPQGNVLNFVSVNRDITHELELERSVRQAQKMEAIGQLAGGIAHDFNNVLYAIMGNTELALSSMKAGDPEAEYLEESLMACRRARELTQRILTFSRSQDRHLRAVDPLVILDEVIGLLRASLPATVTLETRVDDVGVMVYCDATELHQVLLNLGTNAFHALPDGKGTIRFDLLSDDEHVVMIVEDDGVGMNDQVMQRCFEPYFTTKKKSEGTGMGLSIVHGVIVGNGGHVDVDSKPGEGTRITVTLPALEESTGGPGEDTQRSIISAPHHAHVMVVDDEDVILDLEVSTLKRAGYQVTAFRDACEAWSEFKQHPDRYDLLLTDQTMSGMTGADLMAAVRRVKPSLPVIVCTGFSSTFPEKKARRMGVTDYLVKPLELSDLTTAVAAALSPGLRGTA